MSCLCDFFYVFCFLIQYPYGGHHAWFQHLFLDQKTIQSYLDSQNDCAVIATICLLSKLNIEECSIVVFAEFEKFGEPPYSL